MPQTEVQHLHSPYRQMEGLEDITPMILYTATVDQEAEPMVLMIRNMIEEPVGMGEVMVGMGGMVVPPAYRLELGKELLPENLEILTDNYIQAVELGEVLQKGELVESQGEEMGHILEAGMREMEVIMDVEAAAIQLI